MVSVIIPVYNVESYITKCINSVINQSYKDIEIILIDDCTEDKSIQIAEQLLCQQKELPYKIVKHIKNRGLSAARNSGLSCAKGEYVFFLDSDDSLTVDCLESLIKEMQLDSELELVVGNYALCGNESGSPILPQSGIYSSANNDFTSWAGGQKIYVQAWNKLWRKEFIQRYGFKFPEGLNYEDVYWSFVSMCKVSKLAIVNKVTYNYLVRGQSILRSDGIEKRAYHSCQIFILLQDYIFKNDLQCRSHLQYYVSVQFKYYMKYLIRNNTVLAYDIYKKLREIKLWTPFALYRLGETKRNILSSFHQYLPLRYGLIWYNKFTK